MHFFIAPENVALRIVFFGAEAMGQRGGFGGFRVEDGANFDAGLFGEFFENRFGVKLILRGVEDHVIAFRAAREEEQESGEERSDHAVLLW
jgi:hypothetical protein